MTKDKFAQQLLKTLTSKKSMENLFNMMSDQKKPEKRKYFKVGDIVGYIKSLESKISELSKVNGLLKKEIEKLTKQLSKYNLNKSPNGVEGYIFFSQEEYNGLKYLEKDIEKIIHEVKKEVVNKYWNSTLANY